MLIELKIIFQYVHEIIIQSFYCDKNVDCDIWNYRFYSTSCICNCLNYNLRYATNEFVSTNRGLENGFTRSYGSVRSEEVDLRLLELTRGVQVI